jgi:hypothetical protein
MSIMCVKCSCGAVEMTLEGQPITQYCCHCDDCQAMHGSAYACVLYPAQAVTVSGETRAVTLKTTPRTKCAQCETYLFAQVPGYDFRGVNGSVLPEGSFVPQFHVHCRFVAVSVGDNLPHFKDLPARMGGSGELMQW